MDSSPTLKGEISQQITEPLPLNAVKYLGEALKEMVRQRNKAHHRKGSEPQKKK